MSRTSHPLLIALSGAAVSFLALAFGGTWGPYGPSSVVGMFGLLGLLLSLMLAFVLILGRAARAIGHLLRSCSGSGAPLVR